MTENKRDFRTASGTVIAPDAKAIVAFIRSQACGGDSFNKAVEYVAEQVERWIATPPAAPEREAAKPVATVEIHPATGERCLNCEPRFESLPNGTKLYATPPVEREAAEWNFGGFNHSRQITGDMQWDGDEREALAALITEGWKRIDAGIANLTSPDVLAAAAPDATKQPSGASASPTACSGPAAPEPEVSALRVPPAGAADAEWNGYWQTLAGPTMVNGPAEVAFHEPLAGEDDWCEWQVPVPRGYLMKCCDCGLVHEVEFDAVKATKLNADGMWDGEVLPSTDYRVRLRMRRASDPTSTDPGRPVVTGSTVVSKPGAAIRVEEIHLSDAGRKAITIAPPTADERAALAAECKRLAIAYATEIGRNWQSPDLPQGTKRVLFAAIDRLAGVKP